MKDFSDYYSSNSCIYLILFLFYFIHNCVSLYVNIKKYSYFDIKNSLSTSLILPFNFNKAGFVLIILFLNNDKIFYYFFYLRSQYIK